MSEEVMSLARCTSSCPANGYLVAVMMSSTLDFITSLSPSSWANHQWLASKHSVTFIGPNWLGGHFEVGPLKQGRIFSSDCSYPTRLRCRWDVPRHTAFGINRLRGSLASL
ncbi:hypothetical protein KC338_g35 [Hortaea werneckii]|nr:hypothetical protein KC338_g35 [Hortaea werneckii]